MKILKKEGILLDANRIMKKVIVIDSNKMGDGSEELSTILLKNYIYALTTIDEKPDTMIFYNSGANLVCEGSESVEDLRKLQEDGVEIKTCGTCLDYYGLKDKLVIGDVTNMYDIVETLLKADSVIRP